MTSPAGTNSSIPTTRPTLRLLAVTACPTGIAHTYMAAEKLAQAAEALGHQMKVETQGSIGAENVLTNDDISAADGIIIAADKDVDRSRFAGKRVLVVPVADGIRHPERLIEQVGTAPVYRPGGAKEGGGSGARDGASAPRGRGVVYKSLMNGVSYMIPFVVVGGLLIAVSLAIGGDPDPQGGLVIPEHSFWKTVNDIGSLGFQLMVPILSGYIAYAIADRPGLVPGMIGGWIANTGSFYDSKASAGFLGAILTGFAAGYLARAIKNIKVPKFVRPIMPIIVIPIVTTLVVGGLFILALGRPIAWLFTHLTTWLDGMNGSSAALLGIIVGLMIAFDMGGPVAKTAFLFAVGLIPSGNEAVMGMCAAAIPVPPLGMGVATLVRRGLFTGQEREAGYAALFMGCFGITEGAIPFAAARPARIIPANMLGGAAAGAVAGIAGVDDAVPHGGPIVAILGAIGGVPMFSVAVAIGVAVTGFTAVGLISLRSNRSAGPAASVAEAATGPDGAAGPAVAASSSASGGPEVTDPEQDGERPESGTAQAAAVPEVLSGYLTERTVKEQLDSTDKVAAIREMVRLLAETGPVADQEGLVAAVLAREEQGTTGLGDEIAIPHAKTDAVSAPVVGFARSAKGIDWGSFDSTLAKLVFMISVPQSAANDEHLRILALLSQKLMDADFRAALQAAPDRAGIMAVLAKIG